MPRRPVGGGGALALSVRRSLVLLVTGGVLSVAGAQRDTITQSRAVATVDSTMPTQPTSAAAAEAAGFKLLGVMDAHTGAWVDGATVRDTLGDETRTSTIGVAVLNALQPLMGWYMLEVRKPGYAPQRFKLRADSAAEFLVAIRPSPLGSTATLPTVVVTGQRLLWSDAGQKEGFITRCGEAVLSCLGRKELDKHPAVDLGHLIVQAPGMHCVFPPDPTTPCIPMMISKFGAAPCIPTYYLNGLEVPLYFIAAFFDTKHTYGIEIYRSTVARPARFDKPGSRCGAIVIWTQ